MVEAIKQVAAGEQILSPTMVSQEIAMAVAGGLTNADIARQHFMSLAAVKAHVTRILEKWGASNRVQIAIRVRDASTDPQSRLCSAHSG